ncbi:MAG: molybdate ABC transporter permease subunit, partial [Pseudomonadaceae bacterium]|nr:molybdate ABC transporter permease subunit [Pseudomonadaceae bacterium]
MPTLDAQAWQAIILTARLAAWTTVVLLIVATPVAWWLAHTGSRWRAVVGAVVT